MQDALMTVAYLVSGILFILSLRGLSSQETAGAGNTYGIVGMSIAIGATLCLATTNRIDMGYMGYLAPALVIAVAIGWMMAARVAMTAMPELVALLHSFVGLAAVLVGFATYFDQSGSHHGSVFLWEVFIDIFIGAITFTGSIIAFLKLKGTLSGKPLLLPARHFLNLAMVVGSFILGYMFVAGTTGMYEVTAAGTKVPAAAQILASDAFLYLCIMTGIASILGVHLVAAIGGADMPVVVSMLNSYSGWTASAAGFMLGNDLLIITGALVGSSGAILSYIMCKAMNRSIWNVIFGGFGTTGGSSAPAQAAGEQGTHQETDVDTLASELTDARDVVIVPGYGMAVARAQHAVHELTKQLKEKGVRVRFAIHPVAGRLPGHMNVLLAEANVPYDIVLEMEDINDDFDRTDVVLVIGANDIVNPSAMDDPSCDIYGMPVCEVWNAKRTVIFKRSMGSGYAGIQNPLFFYDDSRMLLGDAKDSVEKLVSAIRG
ncbi:MAG: NAD(P)(+) transhydrogenase (Re/Si-specific) subunit beta [Bradymonadia bacterium]